MDREQTISEGAELYRAAWERQLRRSAATIEKIARGRYGPAEAIADGQQAWLDTLRLGLGLSFLWSRSVADSLDPPPAMRGPRGEDERALDGPVHVSITELSYG